MSTHPDVFTTPVTLDDTDPPGYRGGEATAVRELGAGGELTVRVYELAAGQALRPLVVRVELIDEGIEPRAAQRVGDVLVGVPLRRVGIADGG